MGVQVGAMGGGEEEGRNRMMKVEHGTIHSWAAWEGKCCLQKDARGRDPKDYILYATMLCFVIITHA